MFLDGKHALLNALKCAVVPYRPFGFEQDFAMSQRLVFVVHRTAAALAAALLAVTPMLASPALAAPTGATATDSASSAEDAATSPKGAPDHHPVAGGSPSVTELATTPIRDLNLDGKHIPAVLNAAVADPYRVPQGAGGRKARGRAGGACGSIASELAALDAVLGPDIDAAHARNRPYTPGNIAQMAVDSLIPFGGIVREVSGAANKQRRLQIAVNAGFARRGFLKGLGLARGCPAPARPE